MLATRIETIQEAIRLSLQLGPKGQELFTFCRALKAFAVTTRTRLNKTDLQSAFANWWSVAKDTLPAGSDFEEWRFDFEDTFAKTKSPLGANSLEEAKARLDREPLPAVCARYTSERIRRLLALCYHLQQMQGGSPFFLGMRDAARICGGLTPTAAGKLLKGLIADGYLVLVDKGDHRHAFRYRFIDSTTPGPTSA